MNDARWQNIEFGYTEPPQEFINKELEKYDEIVKQFCKIAEFDKSRVEVNIQTLKDLSKESMFLMFDPFYFTYLCNSSISEDNLNIL